MRNLFMLTLFIILQVFEVPSARAELRRSKSVIIGTNFFPPFTQPCNDPNESLDGVCGFEADLFRLACKRVGLKCVFVNDPNFENLFTEMKSSDPAYDMVAAALALSARERSIKDFFYSASYFITNQFFVGRKQDSYKLSPENYPISFDSHEGNIKIGVEGGGNLFKEMQRAYLGENPLVPNAKVEIFELKSDQLVQALKSRQVDLIFSLEGSEHEYLDAISDAVIVSNDIATNNPDFQRTGTLHQRSFYGYSLCKKISRGIMKVRQSGEYAEISQKWFGKDKWDKKEGPVPGKSFKACNSRLKYAW